MAGAIAIARHGQEKEPRHLGLRQADLRGAHAGQLGVCWHTLEASGHRVV